MNDTNKVLEKINLFLKLKKEANTLRKQKFLLNDMMKIKKNERDRLHKKSILENIQKLSKQDELSKEDLDDLVNRINFNLIKIENH